jgi:hypothetical protein
VVPVNGHPERSSSSVDVRPFACLLQHLVRFCNGFPKFKTKLYTGTLLSQVSHRKTANSRKLGRTESHEQFFFA